MLIYLAGFQAIPTELLDSAAIDGALRQRSLEHRNRQMALALKGLVQEVDSATNREEALTVSVRRVKEAMMVDACYICLADMESGGAIVSNDPAVG